MNHSNTPSPIKRTTCAVCGLRADVLICKECAEDPQRSIAWLTTLPESERTKTALTLLRSIAC